MSDGSVWPANTEYHPDLAVELLRQQEVEATLRQAGARARPKSANDRGRLHVFWLQSTPNEGVEIDRLITLNELRSWVVECNWLPTAGFLPLAKLNAVFGQLWKEARCGRSIQKKYLVEN